MGLSPADVFGEHVTESSAAKHAEHEQHHAGDAGVRHQLHAGRGGAVQFPGFFAQSLAAVNDGWGDRSSKSADSVGWNNQF